MPQDGPPSPRRLRRLAATPAFSISGAMASPMTSLRLSTPPAVASSRFPGRRSRRSQWSTVSARGRKEGLYLGVDLSPEHPRVRAGLPLHGANLWPREVPELRPAVDAYMSATIKAAHGLMQGIALARLQR